jgi:hypothetical protein
MKKLALIIGDSFSSDNSEKSWTTMLDMPVMNLSKRGISEYKIYQEIKKITPDDFSHIIINHTSPNRIYIPENPYYKNNNDYKHCDLIYTDIKSYLPDEFAKNVVWYFENIFDVQQAELMHNLLIDHIIEQMPTRTIHITFFNDLPSKIHKLHQIWKKYPGDINHLSEHGNAEVATHIRKLL